MLPVVVVSYIYGVDAALSIPFPAQKCEAASIRKQIFSPLSQFQGGVSARLSLIELTEAPSTFSKMMYAVAA